MIDGGDLPTGAFSCHRQGDGAGARTEVEHFRSDWHRERQDLIDKNEVARSKVAAMIDRLRAME